MLNLLPPVDDSLCLSCGPFDAAFFKEYDICADIQDDFEFVLDVVLDLCEVFEVAGEGVFFKFDFNREFIEHVFIAVQDELEVFAHLRNSGNNVLDLGRENVDSPYNQHVIGSAEDA